MSKYILCWEENEQLLRTIRSAAGTLGIAEEFYQKLKSAYSTAGQYIQKKYPLDNQLLICLSGLNPSLCGHSKCHFALQRLYPYFKWLLEGEEYGDYFEEIHKYQLYRRLLEFNVGQRMDLWWNSVFKSNEYPALSVVVKAALSILTGTQIEASFSMMNDLKQEVVMHAYINLQCHMG